MIKKLFKLLPERTRFEFYRKLLKIEPLDHNYEVKIATTQEELEESYKILHDVYVKKGLMNPDPSGLRCTLYSALPFTTVIIAKHQGRVVGTVSVIKDSLIGFPSDKDYKKENDRFRERGFHICEISALAVVPEYRKKKTGSLISLYLMKFLGRYAQDHMKCDMLMATVHPNVFDFYKFMFNFRKNGEVVQYKYVNDALAIHITSSLRQINHWLKEQFNSLPQPQNFYQFVYDDNDPVNKFPHKKNDFSLHPVMTLDLLKYFFIEKTQLFTQLSVDELKMVKSAYSLYFDISEIELFRFIPVDNRYFRYLCHFEAAIYVDNRIYNGVIHDISMSGAFISIKSVHQLPAVGGSIKIHFNMNDKIQELSGSIVHKNKTQTKRHPQGIGIQFKVANSDLLSAIHDMHLNYKKQPNMHYLSKKLKTA